MKAPEVLVTGAGGFVGRVLVPHLAQRCAVVAVVRPGGAAPSAADVVELDLSVPLRRERLPARIDAVIHLAQSPRYREFPEGAADMLAVNVDSTVALAEYARSAGARSFVFASSGGIYGTGPRPFRESDPPAPPNFYLASRTAAEALVLPYGAFFATIALRFFFVYGPGQRGMLVASLAERITSGSPVTVQGDPGLRLNPIFVDDAVRVIDAALELEAPAVLNVAGEEVVSLTELARLLGEAAGRTPVIEHTPAAAGADVVADVTRLRRVLAVAPRTSLRDGLARVIAG